MKIILHFANMQIVNRYVQKIQQTLLNQFYSENRPFNWSFTAHTWHYSVRMHSIHFAILTICASCWGILNILHKIRSDVPCHCCDKPNTYFDILTSDATLDKNEAKWILILTSCKLHQIKGWTIFPFPGPWLIIYQLFYTLIDWKWKWTGVKF